MIIYFYLQIYKLMDYKNDLSPLKLKKKKLIISLFGGHFIYY